ncbi:MAG: hypothetical protein ACMUIP_14775 [bacterium]
MKGFMKSWLTFLVLNVIICICIMGVMSGCGSIEESLDEVEQAITHGDEEAVQVSAVAAVAGLAQTTNPSDLTSIDSAAGEIPPSFDINDYALLGRNKRELSASNDCRTITAVPSSLLNPEYIDYTINFLGGEGCDFADGNIVARWYTDGNSPTSITYQNLTSDSCTIDGSISIGTTTSGNNTIKTYTCEEFDLCGRIINCTCQITTDSNDNIVSLTCSQDNEYTIDGQTATIDSTVAYNDTNNTYSGTITITYTADDQNIDVTYTLTDIYIDANCDMPTGGTMEISDWSFAVDPCAGGTKAISFENTTCENKNALYICGDNETEINFEDLESIIESSQ